MSTFDAGPTRALYDHARWLLDAEHARLASIEARASALLGWAGAQLALTAAVLVLVAQTLDGWWAAAVGVLLVASGMLAAWGAWLAMARVVRTSTVPAANKDLGSVLAAVRSGQGTCDQMLDKLVGSLLEGTTDGPDGAEGPVLPGFAKAVNGRAMALNRAAAAQGRALLVMACGLVVLLAALIQGAA